MDHYRIKYVKPTAEISPPEQRLTFGAVLKVSKDGKPYATLYPSRNYYSGVGGGTRYRWAGGGPIRSFFEGEATSEVGRKTTVGGDVWTAMQPDLGPLNPLINKSDRKLEQIGKGVSPKNMPGPAGARLRSRAWRFATSSSGISRIRRRRPSASTSIRWSPGSGSVGRSP